MPRTLRLVVNPAAGHGRVRRILPQVTAALDAAAAAYEVRESAGLDHARELAAAGARAGQVIVAVGGDGTAGAVAGAVASSAADAVANTAADPGPGRGAATQAAAADAVPDAGAGGVMGLIPAGRGNDLARMLRIPAAPTAAVDVLTSGRRRAVDLIGVTVDGRPPLMVAGSVYLGVPSVAGEIAGDTRWLPGPAVYPVAALRALARWRPAPFQVECAGPEAGPAARHDFAGYAVVVANSAYFGAGMRVAPTAALDDGILDIVLMRHGPRLAFVRALLKVRDGSHTSLPLISLERGTQVTVTVGRPLPAAADGEALPGGAPLPAGAALRVRVLPAALTMLVPAETDGPG